MIQHVCCLLECENELKVVKVSFIVGRLVGGWFISRIYMTTPINYNCNTNGTDSLPSS